MSIRYLSFLGGDDHGTLLFETNDPREEYRSFEIQLSARTVEPRITVEPEGTDGNPIHLGEVLWRDCSDPKQIVISRNGSYDVEIYSVENLQYSRSTELNWIVDEFSPGGAIILTEEDDEFSFNVTFCPNGLTGTMWLTLGICSNDVQDVMAHPGSGETIGTNLCPEGYGCEKYLLAEKGLIARQELSISTKIPAIVSTDVYLLDTNTAMA